MYNVNDTVLFSLDGKNFTGTIAIVDTFGTFFDHSQPYYDINVISQEGKMLIKHVPQSCIRSYNG